MKSSLFRIGILALFTASAHAQTLRLGGGLPTPTAPVAQSPTLSLQGLKPNLAIGLSFSASPGTVSFALTPGGISPGSASINMTTSCGLAVATTIAIYGYFATPSAALTSAAGNITSAQVKGKSTSVSSFTAFTQTNTVGPAGGSLQLLTSHSFLCLLGSRTDMLDLEIDLSGTPQQPAGSYTGTLTLVATST